ncbi:hypothetical protein HMPREF1030_05860 [Pseudomonas aeruginosa]|nr:hypothetical protein HMPREF1030_05860 [Pseudomonas aeruginosa]
MEVSDPMFIFFKFFAMSINSIYLNVVLLPF